MIPTLRANAPVEARNCSKTHALLLALTCAIVANVAAAQAADAPPSTRDPLQAPDCRRALQALRVQEARAEAAASAPSDAHRRGPVAGLEEARRRAAQACLASRADQPPQPQRLAQPPVAVPPVTMARPAPPSPPLPPAPPSAPKPVDRPRFITSCDAVGCWADDGSRLDRVGPNLWGKRGPCTLVGTLLQCP